jgi:hypothetical protein
MGIELQCAALLYFGESRTNRDGGTLTVYNGDTYKQVVTCAGADVSEQPRAEHLEKCALRDR